MFRPFLHHTLMAAGILLGSHAAFAESRVALVIGQSNYRAVVSLPNPANDARAMSQLFGNAGFEVMDAADLSQDEMRGKVGDFAAKVGGERARYRRARLLCGPWPPDRWREFSR